MPNATIISEETVEETGTKIRNWKKYVKPAAFVALTVVTLAGTIVLSRKMTAENSIED